MFEDKYCKRCNEFVCWVKIVEQGLYTEIYFFCNHCAKYDKDFDGVLVQIGKTNE